jgi:Domain of unknown function (DUF4124)
MRGLRAVGSLGARTTQSTITRAIALLVLLLIPSLSSAAIYKCTAQDGSITYTDEPCPADTTTQSIDPAAPSWLNESSQTMDNTPVLPNATFQSQPEMIAILCANDEFKVWLKAQRQSIPERDTRTAKFIELSNLCRRALHLPAVAAPIPQTPLRLSSAGDAANAAYPNLAYLGRPHKEEQPPDVYFRQLLGATARKQ